MLLYSLDMFSTIEYSVSSVSTMVYKEDFILSLEVTFLSREDLDYKK